MSIENSVACPCKSGKSLKDCCAPYHDGTVDAPTAEALMRSRYAAFVLDLSEYIWKTWHESTRPELEILGGLSLKWVDLKIVDSQAGTNADDKGIVHFIASFVTGNKGRILNEVSDFVKEDGLWYYVDGESTTADISRNDSCPCGSGTKFKRCCLK